MEKTKMKLQIITVEKIKDEYGHHFKITKIKLSDENGKFIKFVKLNDVIMEHIKNAIIEI